MATRKSNKNAAEVTSQGYAYIKVSFNNTLVTITNARRETLVNSSSGKVGFKGSKKSTPFATGQAARECAAQAFKKGVREVQVRIKGLGRAREYAIRGLTEGKLQVTSIRDCTPEPYNGCRPPKKRNL